MAYKPDKHGRDHCPGGEDPIPCLNSPWIVLVNSGQTLAGDNVIHDSVFTEAYWDETITPNPETVGQPFEINSVSDGEGNDIWQLTCNKEGWFDFEVVHEIAETTSNGGATVFFMQELTHTGGAVFTADNPFAGRAAPWTATGPELVITPYIQSFRRIWLNPSSIITVNLRQNSGANKEVDGHMKVFYRAGFGGLTDNTTWQFASSF